MKIFKIILFVLFVINTYLFSQLFTNLYIFLPIILLSFGLLIFSFKKDYYSYFDYYILIFTVIYFFLVILLTTTKIKAQVLSCVGMENCFSKLLLLYFMFALEPSIIILMISNLFKSKKTRNILIFSGLIIFIIALMTYNNFINILIPKN